MKATLRNEFESSPKGTKTQMGKLELLRQDFCEWKIREFFVIN